MRVLVISDVHGNDIALQAVLAAESYDRLIFLGDAVDHGVQPAAVIHRLRSRADVALRGNHDTAVLDADPGESSDNDSYRRKQWNKQQLAAADIRWLETQPRTRSITMQDREVRVHHGHFAPPALASVDEWRNRLNPDRPQALFEHLGNRYPEAMILHGHSHIPFCKTVGATEFVNPGAVGLQWEGWPVDEARYAVIEDDEISLKSVRYDVERFVKAVRSAEVPGTIIADLNPAYGELVDS